MYIIASTPASTGKHGNQDNDKMLLTEGFYQELTHNGPAPTHFQLQKQPISSFSHWVVSDDSSRVCGTGTREDPTPRVARCLVRPVVPWLDLAVTCNITWYHHALRNPNMNGYSFFGKQIPMEWHIHPPNMHTNATPSSATPVSRATRPFHFQHRAVSITDTSTIRAFLFM